MGAEARLKELGIELPGPHGKTYLNLACRVGNIIYASGHVSDLKGKLGADVPLEKGQEAARDAMLKLLNSVRNVTGTLDGIRVVRLLGCVNCTPEFTDQHLVINGASDLVHAIFGKEDLGYHARSALGFAQIPTGSAVEVEGIFAIET